MACPFSLSASFLVAWHSSSPTQTARSLSPPLSLAFCCPSCFSASALPLPSNPSAVDYLTWFTNYGAEDPNSSCAPSFSYAHLDIVLQRWTQVQTPLLTDVKWASTSAFSIFNLPIYPFDSGNALHFNVLLNLLRVLLKWKFSSSWLRWSLKFSLSSNFPGNSNSAGPRIVSEQLISRREAPCYSSSHF